MSTVYYCYGRGAEYSLGPIELALQEAGRTVVSVKDFTSDEFKILIEESDHQEKILLSSAHPGINILTGRKNISIAELRRIHEWKLVAFFPHDLSEPFRWEERIYLNDYDFFVSEFNLPFWVASYVPIIHVEGLSRKKEIIDLDQDFLFLPDNFYSFGLQAPSEFIHRFPFVLQKNVVTKFADIPDAYSFTDELKSQFDLKILSPSIPGFEVITPANGVLLTQGPSGVLTEAQISNMDAIYVNETPLSDWMKQGLVSRFPSIVDFHSASEPELAKRPRGARPTGINRKALNISNLLAACES